MNKHPQRFAEPRPHLTISGPKKSTPENIKGGLYGCNLSLGRGAMTCFIDLSFNRRHLKQFLMIFFAKPLPPSIQNIFLVCAGVCSLPAWARLSWQWRTISWLKWCFFESMIGCFSSPSYATPYAEIIYSSAEFRRIHTISKNCKLHVLMFPSLQTSQRRTDLYSMSQPTPLRNCLNIYEKLKN